MGSSDCLTSVFSIFSSSSRVHSSHGPLYTRQKRTHLTRDVIIEYDEGLLCYWGALTSPARERSDFCLQTRRRRYYIVLTRRRAALLPSSPSWLSIVTHNIYTHVRLNLSARHSYGLCIHYTMRAIRLADCVAPFFLSLSHWFVTVARVVLYTLSSMCWLFIGRTTV